ncbi:glucosamine-6-phosphate deaminase [Corynebacterium uterequi]|uniref:Glucosamine-6-phosphate deaminase n=1 Tax=Corynebacterium uterequi TaxID=1072256 RepID=A0A0G3HBH9_9CORY|nr:glucosamine-6-phosphate deaminase [Corynebacterium uterequi]AKK10746.1 glucosamine-6-phosphate isomerase [Corynebacterium uterequi]
MEVVICPARPEHEEVGRVAADVYAPYVARGGVIGLATGSTPLPMYRELRRRVEAGELSFANCTAFLLDEYVGLPRDHEQSYYQTIRRELTNHIDIDDARVFSPDGTADNPDEAGVAYDKAIAEHGGIDIQLLGVGTNGHVGFNEPGSSLGSGTRMKTLHPQTVIDNARFFEDDPNKVPHHVLTQGLGTISRAGHLLLLATGAGKADAVAALVEGPISASCPASILQYHPHATVVVDEAAASKLTRREYYEFAYENKPEWQQY